VGIAAQTPAHVRAEVAPQEADHSEVRPLHDVDDLMADVGFTPATPIREGIERFVAWYRSYHGLA
jgi:nucleoside-diphosphate-sugar epimerase